MSEDIESCGKGLHEWKTDGEEGWCVHCHTYALDWSIEDDDEGYFNIIVNTHENTLHDELKAVRETPPKDRSIKWDNLEPVDYNLNTGPVPKITTVVPTLKFRIECDVTDTTYEEYEE